jgi:hypothetical protein
VGADHVPEPEHPSPPHVSLGYLNADGPAEPFITALDANPATAHAAISRAQLIVLNRDSGMYIWKDYADARLGRG